MIASFASHNRAAFAATASSTGWISVGELAMTPRISLVAVCCSRSSITSRRSSSIESLPLRRGFLREAGLGRGVFLVETVLVDLFFGDLFVVELVLVEGLLVVLAIRDEKQDCSAHDL